MSTRREILQRFTYTGLSALAGGGFFGGALAAGAHSAHTEKVITVQAIHEAFVSLDPDMAEQLPRNNLFRAWELITPKLFHEFVFLTWCARHWVPTTHFAEEFVRRRQGDPVELPDHPVFDVCQDMYRNWRLPVYQEHIELIIGSLTGVAYTERRQLYMKILRSKYGMGEKFGLNKFRAMLLDNPYLPESVHDADIPKLWNGLRMTVDTALPLGSCAMLTGQVLDTINRDYSQ